MSAWATTYGVAFNLLTLYGPRATPLAAHPFYTHKISSPCSVTICLMGRSWQQCRPISMLPGLVWKEDGDALVALYPHGASVDQMLDHQSDAWRASTAPTMLALSTGAMPLSSPALHATDCFFGDRVRDATSSSGRCAPTGTAAVYAPPHPHAAL